MLNMGEILEVLQGPEGLKALRYEDLRSFWSVVMRRLLDDGLPEPIEVGLPSYKQWDNTKQDFILTDEGQEVADRVFAAIVHGETIPDGDTFRVPEVIKDEEIELIVAQLNDIVGTWFSPADWSGAGQPGKPRQDMFNRFIFSSTVKGAHAESMARDIMLELVRKKEKGSGLGK